MDEETSYEALVSGRVCRQGTVTFVGGVVMKKQIAAFLKDESGQTSTEYILLVAVVAFVIFKFKDVLNNKLVGDNGLVNKVFQNADSLLNNINQ